MTANVLVTGANGQLGQCLKALSSGCAGINFEFVSSAQLDIANRQDIDVFFRNKNYDYCINCAAYTAVDLAEKEEVKAFLINAESVQHLANACKVNSVTLIHFSTDFVFDGKKSSPYTEDDQPNPINVYGSSKLKGETYIQSVLEHYFIIRTSWLYSEYGHNFVKTMLRLSSEKDKLTIVNDQIGSPTHAMNLAEFVIRIIISKSSQYGIYNYSNSGETSWHEFAKAIFELKQKKITILPIPTTEYPTPASRPKYSVLNTQKAQRTFNIEIENWKTSLKKALQKL